MRWDRRSNGFMEVWYLTLNHAATGSGAWARYTITSPVEAPPYCELWGFWFDPDGASFAAKERFTIDHLGSANGRDDGALVRIGDAWLSETHAEGSVKDGSKTMSWSFDWEPASACFQHLPPSLRDRIEKRVSTVCSPNLSVPFSGTVKVGRKKFQFDGDIGAQSHRWGRKHSRSWTWAHCASFEGPHTALFEGLAARAAIGPIPAPTTTFLYMELDGERLTFNELKWALRAKSRYELPTWAFSAYNDDWKIAGAARARVDRSVQVQYADPDGSPRFCANSEIADMAIEVYGRSAGAWRHHTSLTSTGLAHLEFGRPEPFTEMPIAF